MIAEQEVAEEINALSSMDTLALRRMAQEDLYFMAKGILGYPDVNIDTHGEFCRFFDSEPKLRRLGLMPRSHLKSTIATIADSIRIVVDNPEHERVLISSETCDAGTSLLEGAEGTLGERTSPSATLS
jgi:hypothetical protein